MMKIKRLQHQKKKIIGKESDIYKKLSENKYVKESLDEYLENKEKNKDKKKFDGNESKNLLFEYCDENKKVPTNKTEYKGKLIGSWLYTQKKNIIGKESDIYKKLSENKYVKESLDEYLKNKEKN